MLIWLKPVGRVAALAPDPITMPHLPPEWQRNLPRKTAPRIPCPGRRVNRLRRETQLWEIWPPSEDSGEGGVCSRFHFQIAGAESMTSRIVCHAYPRLGLMGNPMDAVGGAAVSVTFRDFEAEAVLEPAESIRFVEPEVERPEWDSIEALERHVTRLGHYGGRRLMSALLVRLARYARERGLAIPERGFSLTWRSTIPPRVGLAGSSALLTASLRAILQHWALDISLLDQVEIVLSTERDELKIPAGPQDRVAQVFEGLVFLEPDAQGRLAVETLDSGALPPLFVAIDESSSEGTEVFHSDLRGRYERGEPAVLEGRRRQSELARQCRDLVKAGCGAELGALMDENFAIRRRLTRLNPRHEQMVDMANAAGAHAKFAGSGGTIVGTCEAEKMDKVLERLRAAGYHAFRPAIHDPRRLGL